MERVKVQPLDILRMLENLHDLAVERPKTVFGSLVWGLNKEEVAMQIAKVRASLPAELKQAASLTRESERIVENAKEDATVTIDRAQREAQIIIEEGRLDSKGIIENSKAEAQAIIEEAKQKALKIIEEAKQKQQEMLTENEVLKITKVHCQELWNNTNQEASEVRKGAESYAYDTLCHLETVVVKLINTIEMGKAELCQEEKLPLDTPEKTALPQ